MESIADGIQYLVDFFTGDNETSIWDHVQAYIVIWWIKIKLFAVSHAWGVAQAVLQQLNISSAISEAWTGVDPTIMSLLSTFKIPEATNMLVQAHTTRLVLTFMRL